MSRYDYARNGVLDKTEFFEKDVLTMTKTTEVLDPTQALAALESAEATKNLSEGAQKNIRLWLTEPRYSEFAPQVAEHLSKKQWQALDNAFWTIIPFGTGGRRGRMYPIGSNAINVRTIGESARGLAEYVLEHGGHEKPACAIAFDTRHRSTEFARLCAEVMVAAGFKVYFLDEFRSTPALSFMVRHKGCACGIMVTASHNPPSDNAVKCYWSTGGQIMPPHDQGVIDRVMQVQEIPRVDFDEALTDGRIEVCNEEIDRAFIDAVVSQRFDGPRGIKILYSPLHGVGSTAVVPALAADGFEHVEVYERHAKPDGDFPNVPGNVSNPENAAVFDDMIEYAKKSDFDLILATDPDCDRLGCAAPLTTDKSGPWKTFNGNQICALLTDYVLEQQKQQGGFAPDSYVIKTLVTTDMVKRICDSYGVKTVGNLQVGFKWIGGAMDEFGPDKFLFGSEESHGYLVGTHVRDKDGAVAAMMMSELAARVAADGKSLHEKMDDLYWQHGYHAERLLNVMMEGSEGMTRMQALMAKFRADPPKELGGQAIVRIRDYGQAKQWSPGNPPEPLDGPDGNLIILDLAETGNYVAVRPSGTEPKVKFYEFTYVPAEQLANLEMTAEQMQSRLDQFESDLHAFAKTV